jgi:hypothetical protein
VIDGAGVASVQNILRWRVVHGPLAGFDISNVDPTAVLESDVAIASEDGRPVSAGHLLRREGSTARVTIDEPRALMRGVFSFDVRWRVDLSATGALMRDGAAWRLTLTGPVASDGFDVARTIVDLPAAPEPPRAIDPESGAPDEAALATLHRGALLDSLELLHPHMARGQAVRWTVRADPRAFFPSAATPVAAAPAAPEPDRIRGALGVVALAVIAATFALLLRAKRRILAARSAAHGARARALVPLPGTALAWIGGGALALAVALQASGETPIGGAFVVVAILAATSLPSRVDARARAAGRWLVLRPAEAFTAPAHEGDAFDLGTVLGVLAALGSIATLVTIACLLRSANVAHAGWLVAIDGAALVPLFVTGGSSQIGAHRVVAGRWIARAFQELRRVDRLKASPWARLATDGSVEELRLWIAPLTAAPGLVGIELGLAWNTTPVGWSPGPELLVRVLEGSAAASILEKAAPRVRPAIGRRREERVVRFTPSSPTRRSAIALTRRLASVLTDRRAHPPKVAWAGRERRAPLAAVRPSETPRAQRQAC